MTSGATLLGMGYLSGYEAAKEAGLEPEHRLQFAKAYGGGMAVAGTLLPAGLSRAVGAKSLSGLAPGLLPKSVVDKLFKGSKESAIKAIRQFKGKGSDVQMINEMVLAAQKGKYDGAINSFGKNLEYFRKYYPVETICMHGSPLSKWDNRLIWDKIDYKDYGIIGEPYIDLDYDQICYITDTGRKWDSKTGNIRDKVESAQRLKITSTFDLIREIKAGTIPNKIMINSHPQRWHNSFGLWLSEYILQNSKNVVKKLLTKYNK